MSAPKRRAHCFARRSGRGSDARGRPLVGAQQDARTRVAVCSRCEFRHTTSRGSRLYTLLGAGMGVGGEGEAEAEAQAQRIRELEAVLLLAQRGMAQG